MLSAAGRGLWTREDRDERIVCCGHRTRGARGGCTRPGTLALQPRTSTRAKRGGRAGRRRRAIIRRRASPVTPRCRTRSRVRHCAPRSANTTPSAERQLVDNVVKRVRLWKEVEPFYPDQTRGLPKTSESRGTESILNALVLATRDARNGRAERRRAPGVRQPVGAAVPKRRSQGRRGRGSTSTTSHGKRTSVAYFGAALAAIAVGRSPAAMRRAPRIRSA